MQRFDKTKLKKLPVFFASNNPVGPKYLPFRGYIVSGFPHLKLHVLRHKENGETISQVTPINARSAGKVYGFAIDRMKISYEVTEDIIEAARDLRIPISLLDALNNLKGKYFPRIDYFVRALVQEEAKILNIAIGPDDMECIFAKIPKPIFSLIEMNILCKNRLGAYAPYFMARQTSIKDLMNFWDVRSFYQEIPVHTTTLMEIYREQLIYFDYIDSQLGVSPCQREEEKAKKILQLNETKIAALTNHTVEQVHIPSHPYESNCNSAAATFVQYAINRERGLPSNTFQPIITSSYLAVGINHRIYMHDPLLLNNCIEALKRYLERLEAAPSGFWGKMFAETNKTAKMSATKKMILFLQQQKVWVSALGEEELLEIQRGELYRILKPYPQAQKIIIDQRANLQKSVSP